MGQGGASRVQGAWPRGVAIWKVRLSTAPMTKIRRKGWEVPVVFKKTAGSTKELAMTPRVISDSFTFSKTFDLEPWRTNSGLWKPRPAEAPLANSPSTSKFTAPSYRSYKALEFNSLSPRGLADLQISSGLESQQLTSFKQVASEHSCR